MYCWDSRDFLVEVGLSAEAGYLIWNRMRSVGSIKKKMDEDAANHNSAHAWSNLTGTPLNVLDRANQMLRSREDFGGDGAYCSSAPMVDSFGSGTLDRASDPLQKT
ncbi:hypothetical protein MLD38_017458 [Melastoma candidum]|uniref:Uncharacterized protein n=1 Tax=Melastoma candidum TaxID=119954 RepID=A0ACB9QU74_9MYRT|nr:hypothetical protein MLD38_017458 [Melastoma candidum]